MAKMVDRPILSHHAKFVEIGQTVAEVRQFIDFSV